MLRRLVPLVVPWLVCNAAAQDVDPGGGADCALTPPPTLTKVEALRRLRACNRDLRAARRAVGGATADVQVASQPPNPTATLGVGTYNWQLGIGPGPWTDKTLDTSVRVEQVVERGGKLELRKRGAELLAAAAREDVSEVERQQGTAMLQAMVDLAAARARVEVLEELLHLYDESVRANARRLAQGDIARIDAQRQAVEAARARTDLAQARTDMQRARLALAVQLGWEAHAAALSADPAILDEIDVPARSIAPEERADARAARTRVEAAAAARELARSG
jgi:cobalt-zinc-cadmium efflux system outer membrane protein